MNYQELFNVRKWLAVKSIVRVRQKSVFVLCLKIGRQLSDIIAVVFRFSRTFMKIAIIIMKYFYIDDVLVNHTRVPLKFIAILRVIC